MIIAQLKSITRLISIKPGGEEDLPNQDGDHSYLRMDIDGPSPRREDRGKAIIQIKPLSNEPLEIGSEVLIPGEVMLKAKLIETKKTFLSGVQCTLYFADIFADGFENVMSEVLTKGTLLIGLSTAEKTTLSTLDTQRALFNQLTDLLLPTRSERIKQLALPCYILKITESDAPAAAYFAGNPLAIPDDGWPSNDEGSALCHVASIKATSIKSIIINYTHAEIKPALSFYLDIENSEAGWPEEPDRFRVVNAASKSDSPFVEEETEPAQGIILETQLDLPGYNHSVLHTLQLSEEESAQYDVLLNTFQSIIGREEGEVHKLFGYPNAVQHCVAYEAERISTGSDYSDALYEKAIDWQLLLQVSPYAHEFSFFDTLGDGTIYYMIRQEDLRAGNFERVQVVVQNT